jgi:multimeric flavodoxin WrbA
MNRFPKEAPAWQAMDADYNKRIDEADAPLFVQPTELGSAELIDGEVLSPITMPMRELNINPMQQGPTEEEVYQDQAGLGGTKDIEAKFDQNVAQGYGLDSSLSPNIQPQAPMSPQEKMMAEYKAMQEQDRKDLQDARSSDRNLKMGGAIGDALATYLNARGQMNVKAPGVQVQQGAGLGKIADMFATAPDVQKNMESRLAEYKALQGGEINPYRQAMLDMRAKDQELKGKSLAETQGRHGENLEFKKGKQSFYEKESQELKPEELKTLQGIEGTLDSIDRLEGMNKEFLTGPIEGRISAISRAIGMDSAKKTTLAAQMKTLLSKYGKQISGTAVGEQEFGRLETQLPTENDSDQAFASKLANFKTEIENSRTRFMKTYSPVRDVSSYEVREPVEAPSKKTLSEKDQKAYDWAIKNPDSAEASEILKELGK